MAPNMGIKSWASDDGRRQLRSIYAILLLFREQDGEMPVQQQLVLCHIALNEGTTQRDLCQALDMAVSSASRNIAALSEVHRLGKPGLGLITWSEDLNDRRSKLLTLTPKGRAFMHRILSVL
jgi:DNA-binding MarR family transcriptional regulator